MNLKPLLTIFFFSKTASRRPSSLIFFLPKGRPFQSHHPLPSLGHSFSQPACFSSSPGGASSAVHHSSSAHHSGTLSRRSVGLSPHSTYSPSPESLSLSAGPFSFSNSTSRDTPSLSPLAGRLLLLPRSLHLHRQRRRRTDDNINDHSNNPQLTDLHSPSQQPRPQIHRPPTAADRTRPKGQQPYGHTIGRLKQRTRGNKKKSSCEEKRICKTEKKFKINCCCALFPLLQVTAGVGRLRRGSQSSPPCCWVFLRRHVNPRAASDGGAWGDAPPVLLRL